MISSETYRSDLMTALIKKDSPAFGVLLNKLSDSRISESLNTLRLAVFDWVTQNINPEKANKVGDIITITELAYAETMEIMKLITKR